MNSLPLSALRSSLLEWYGDFGRLHLPWRNLPTQVPIPHPKLTHIQRAYGVYISEMMLQQTQVSVVQDRYFFPFLASFPDLPSLALADEEEVLKAWQGLGYYSRARNIHKTARIAQELHGGQLPKNRKELQSLPGIGSYTAGAIACFGFGQSASFVDANIARVLSRLFALSSPTPKELEALAQTLLNPLQAFDHNQALIDLGALICFPKAPHCLHCPLSAFCRGKTSPQLYPAPKTRSLTPLTLHLGFCIQEGRISLIKSTSKLYHGLYNPIEIESTSQTSKLLGSFKHHYTRYKITAQVYLLPTAPIQARFFSPKELEALPLSNLCRKALALL